MSSLSRDQAVCIHKDKDVVDGDSDQICSLWSVLIAVHGFRKSYLKQKYDEGSEENCPITPLE